MHRFCRVMLLYACFAAAVSFSQRVVCASDTPEQHAVQVGKAPPANSGSRETGPAPAPTEPEKPEQLAQVTALVPGPLSAADMIELAAEYAWNEDYEGERAWLAAAASMPASTETARAKVLLAEAVLFVGEKAEAQSLLDEVRAQYRDPEIVAFADLVQALGLMAPDSIAHGKRYYSDAENSRWLYAKAARNWRGTPLGGWASIRLAAVYRNQLDQPNQAISVLEQAIRDYAGILVSEYAMEDKAAAVAFNLGGFGEAKELYEQLLSTTTNDFVKQRATLHLGEVLMDTQADVAAHELFDYFIETWPQHVTSVGARMLRGYVAANLNLWDEAVADAKDYLARTAPRLPAYLGKAHLVLGRAAFVQGQLELAESEFGLVEDRFLVQAAQAALGYTRAKRGDLRGAMTAFLAASIGDPGCAPGYLYQAALLARELSDRAVFDQVLARMTVEFPRSHYTVLLAGREVIPAPGI